MPTLPIAVSHSHSVPLLRALALLTQPLASSPSQASSLTHGQDRRLQSTVQIQPTHTFTRDSLFARRFCFLTLITTVRRPTIPLIGAPPPPPLVSPGRPGARRPSPACPALARSNRPPSIATTHTRTHARFIASPPHLRSCCVRPPPLVNCSRRRLLPVGSAPIVPAPDRPDVVRPPGIGIPINPPAARPPALIRNHDYHCRRIPRRLARGRRNLSLQGMRRGQYHHNPTPAASSPTAPSAPSLIKADKSSSQQILEEGKAFELGTFLPQLARLPSSLHRACPASPSPSTPCSPLLQLATDGISTASAATSAQPSSTPMPTSFSSATAPSFATTVHTHATPATTRLRISPS